MAQTGRKFKMLKILAKAKMPFLLLLGIVWASAAHASVITYQLDAGLISGSSISGDFSINTDSNSLTALAINVASGTAIYGPTASTLNPAASFCLSCSGQVVSFIPDALSMFGTDYAELSLSEPGDSNAHLILYFDYPHNSGLLFDGTDSDSYMSFTGGYNATGGTAQIVSDISDVPLPASLPMFGIGFLGLGAWAYVKRRQRDRLTSS